MSRYDEVIEELRRAYDRSAGQRDQTPKSAWKLTERSVFLDRLLSEGKRRLLEVGAGTGHDAAFFAEHGLEVVATDLSPAMVERCRAKGLEAHVMDFLHLDFPSGSFDAAYAFNCLLHFPNSELPTVLANIRRLLTPGGLFYLGVYGGESSEGVASDDWHDPPRFFSFRTDDQIRAFAEEQFEVVDFHVVQPEEDGRVASGSTASGQIRFQSLTLRAVG
jgi:SAM-dependent methyltransferase